VTAAVATAVLSAQVRTEMFTANQAQHQLTKNIFTILDTFLHILGEFTKAKTWRLQTRTHREVKSHLTFQFLPRRKHNCFYITEIDMLREIIAVYLENTKKMTSTVCVR